MIEVIKGSLNKQISADKLKKALDDYGFTGYLYFGEPILPTENSLIIVDALLITKEKGLLIFNLVENEDIEDYKKLQDEYANRMRSKLLNHDEFIVKRELQVEINVLTFAPFFSSADLPESDDFYKICNEESLNSHLESIQIPNVEVWNENKYYEKLLSAIQSMSSIKTNKKRKSFNDSSLKGSKLKTIEDTIATLDFEQNRAVIETTASIQRIRGLAGSGKTIVLALKAARLHLLNPEWKIAITFSTRSLKEQFKRLITNYCMRHQQEPNWENIHVVQAWGASGNQDQYGLYYAFCKEHDLKYYNLSEAKSKFGYEKAFAAVCENALKGMTKSKPLYDVILIDEAQDFSLHFLKLCYELLDQPKRLVYAYDELQNLSNMSLPSPEEIFGKDVQFDTTDPSQDIVLKVCYRNSRPILTTAHSLGFGIYRNNNEKIGTGLVQMFEHDKLWTDIGYEVLDGDLIGGTDVSLGRSKSSSPEFLENHSKLDDLILFKEFETIMDQNQWVADEVEKNLNEEGLLPNDIIIINPNPLTTYDSVSPIRKILIEKGIRAHIVGVGSSPVDSFFLDGQSVACSGIYRAKGNEAAMIYVINAQDCFRADYSNNLAQIRNRLFTAITRSKAWVRVVGIGNEMEYLMEEYSKIKNNNFLLNFKYPTNDQLKHLKLINRDMSPKEKEKIEKVRGGLSILIDELKNNKIQIEDFEEEQIEELLFILTSKRGE